MSFVFAKSIPRRTALRGIGATLALPLLDAMVPAFALRAKAAGAPAHRFQAFYTPNGMAMEYWTPKSEKGTADKVEQETALGTSPIRATGSVPESDAAALRHQGELELHPRRRIGIVPDRDGARRPQRGRDHR